jgi:hypothetical protein
MHIARLAALAAFLASPLIAPTAAGAPACGLAEQRQFDFWVGEWTVHRSDNGKYAGQNRIDSVLGGCALHESWTGTGGVKGHSYNAYDARRGVWHQTWVDSTGDLLVLEGRFVDGKMVLEGEQKGADGKPVQNRITWTPLAGGTVRQRWETSIDGKAWSVSFDGLYSKRDGSAGGAGSGGEEALGLRALRSDI